MYEGVTPSIHRGPCESANDASRRWRVFLREPGFQARGEPAQSREALSSLRLEDFLRSSSLALSSSEYFLSLLEDFFFFFSLRSSSLSSSYLDDFFFDRRSSSLSSSYLLDFFFDL